MRAPRHVVFYFVAAEGDVVISRILHDARDFARHLPPGHRAAAKAAEAPDD